MGPIDFSTIKGHSSLTGFVVAVALGSVVLGPGFSPLAAIAQDKQVIEKLDDLPRHQYELTIPVADLYAPENRDALLELARLVRTDIENDLNTYDIRDDNTVQGFYGLLGTIAMLEEDWQTYLDFLEKRRELESKEANRLTMGLVGEAVARARLAGSDSAEAIAEQLQRVITELPYETVGDSLESLKGRTEYLSRNLVIGNLESNFQPLVDSTGGTISYDVASSLVGSTFTLDHFIPAMGAINGVLKYTIDANKVEKPDIWAARQVELTSDGSPVVMAVWDSGVDTAIFGSLNQLWINEGEIPGNGIDDDDNGYVDDVHGIAYDEDANKVSDYLYPIGDFPVSEPELQQLNKGLGDLLANVDSEAASAVRQQMAALPQDGVNEFLESLAIYGNYSHGTHVAGSAAEGNPHARILVTRMTYGHETIPDTPTLAAAHRQAAMFLEVADYFRRNGVRVVNMSWGGSVRGIEAALEANGAGGAPEERKALAREIFSIGDKALRSAIADSPDILFIVAAGNSDNDIEFDEFYPSSYDYPNMLTVGAVDQAGDETSFTSLGEVDIYGSGFEVESYVPGGNRIPYNGTSMASPQVANLAGKILALNPELSVQELKARILDGSDEKELETRTIRLINPRASVALAGTSS